MFSRLNRWSGVVPRIPVGDGGEGDDEPKGLTKEEVDAAIQDKLNAMDKANKKALDKLKSELSGSITKLTEAVTALAEKGGDDDPDDGDGDGGGDDGKDKVSPEVNAKLRDQAKALDKLTKALEDEKKAREEAESRSKTERIDAAVTRSLATLKFRDEDSAAFAYEAIRQRVSTDEDGNLVVKSGDDDVTLESFIKEQAEGPISHLLQGPDSKGTGLKPGESGNRSGGVHLEDIKPGMDKKTADAALADIAKALEAQ